MGPLNVTLSQPTNPESITLFAAYTELVRVRTAPGFVPHPGTKSAKLAGRITLERLAGAARGGSSGEETT